MAVPKPAEPIAEWTVTGDPIFWYIAGVIVFVFTSLWVLLSLSEKVREAFWKSSADGSESWRVYLMGLPLGAPEGSIRALMSIFVIVFGLSALILKDRLNIGNVEAITGFVGMVITFYFTARSGEQTQKAVDAANQATTAVKQATAQAATAAEAASASSKTLIADVSAKIETATKTFSNSPAVSAPGAEASAPSEAQGELRLIRDGLRSVRAVASVASGLGVGSEVFSGADKTIETVDGLLTAIDPLLGGNPSVESVAAMLGSAGQALALLENAGLPGALAEAVGALGGAMDFAAPVLAGIPGGPIGIVGGLLTAGLTLAEDRRKFEALKTAVLRKPFDPQLLPSVANANGTAAQAALDAAPLPRARLAGVAPGVVTALMRAVIAHDESGAPPSTQALAHALMTRGLDVEGPPFVMINDRFASEEELAKALEEYRSSLIFREADARLDGAVNLPAIGGSQPATIPLRALTAATSALHENPKTSSEIERILYLTEALAKLPTSVADKLDLVAKSFALGEKLLGARRSRDGESSGFPAEPGS